MVHVRQKFGASERRACRVLGQARSTQRRTKKGKRTRRRCAETW